ncbi:MAG: sugar phosphate isomerase/epimerase [Clostridiaceae bacterium]|nr:sugar phosphate isomerase/epimerase [Clostridiaceae bacterium]
MKLSCASPMVPGDSLTQKAKNLRSYGYDGIAVFTEHSEWTDAMMEELQELKDKTGIQPCEFVFSDPYYGKLMHADAGKRLKAKSIYLEAADICARLGIVTELEYEYCAQDPLPLFSPNQKMDDGQMRDFLRTYREVLIPTEGSNAAVLIEPINRYEAPYLNCVADCVDVINLLNHDNSGLLLDFFHMNIEEANIVESILQAGSLIRHVHLADNNRLLPGYGHINWISCLQALKEVKYDGFLSLECSAGGDASKTLPMTAKYLRKILSVI